MQIEVMGRIMLFRNKFFIPPIPLFIINTKKGVPRQNTMFTYCKASKEDLVVCPTTHHFFLGWKPQGSSQPNSTIQSLPYKI